MLIEEKLRTAKENGCLIGFRCGGSKESYSGTGAHFDFASAVGPIGKIVSIPST
jgi:hypothetical protein